MWITQGCAKITKMVKKIYPYIKSIFGLSYQMAKAEFKLRNEGSFLGFFWYLLNPILTFILLFFIFSDRLGNGIQHYSMYLIIGITLFNFFQSTTNEAIKSLSQENHFLIKSINFPKETLILSVVLKNIMSHFFEILLIVFILFYLGINTILILFYIPILFFFIVFIFGISLTLASLTVFFIDLDNIWSFAVRLLWLGTPIFYAIEGQTKLFYFNIFNPLYYFITATRDILIYHTKPENWILFGIIGFSFSVLFIGILIFNKLNKKITELI